MIVSFFGSAYENRGVTFELAFDELAHVLKESSEIVRASSDTAKLTALMFSPAIYRKGDVRSVQNALGADIIALDLDAGDWTIFGAAASFRRISMATASQARWARVFANGDRRNSALIDANNDRQFG